MESHCLFRVGFSSLIKSISKIRQSSLFWHFLKILKFRAMSFGDIFCWFFRWFPIAVPLYSSIRWWRCRHVNGLLARVADITCITQVTLKMINNALLIHKGWFLFPHFDFVLDLSTWLASHAVVFRGVVLPSEEGNTTPLKTTAWEAKGRADSCIDLPTEVCKLSAYCICRFLVLKRQHDSDWGFIVVRNLLLCLWFLRYFGSNNLADGRSYEFVRKPEWRISTMCPQMTLREIFKILRNWSARTNLIASFLKCFLLKNWNQL